MATGSPVLLAWSGGKDAAWTLQRLRTGHDVVGLITTITAGDGRVAMQGIRVSVLHAQAQALGLPLVEVRTPLHADNHAYEAAFADGLQRARSRWPGLTHVAFGDLALADIRAYRESLCARLGWTPVFPLFGMDTGVLARTMLAGGLRARLCCVDTTQLAAEFAGRGFDQSLLDDLPAGIDPCGENGEFHTCVWDGPMFRAPLALECGATGLRDARFAVADLWSRDALDAGGEGDAAPPR